MKIKRGIGFIGENKIQISNTEERIWGKKAVNEKSKSTRKLHRSKVVSSSRELENHAKCL